MNGLTLLFKSVLIFSLAVRNIGSIDKILSLGLTDFDRFGGGGVELIH